MRELLASLAVIFIMAIAAALLNKPGRAKIKGFIKSRPVSRIIIWYYAKKADKRFPGDGRGAEKKEWVEKQADRWKIKICRDADDIIDSVVAWMNLKSGSMKGQLGDKASGAVDELAGKISEGNNDQSS